MTRQRGLVLLRPTGTCASTYDDHWLRNRAPYLLLDYQPRPQNSADTAIKHGVDAACCCNIAFSVFMDIAVRRSGSQIMDEPGAYLLSFSLYGKEERGRKQVWPSERDQWQTHWVDMVKKLKRTRYAIEEKLIRQGYTIDTGYIEPIVHPADPVEP